ncbi:aspartyl/glutamyl-tRNA(Asn/Gln) amidotransferase subunit B [Gaeumannomyces tritici R3-111a-1]|uniref:Glutamyl-tRNA(Gln) amidotransferase subunit B, mitochondrial n=1 Tax=Gaeumannomyces tritici (strain R3-111a-1) TaxID=644352 RepID=J3NXE2_GAET3|nr:aspartyl/glutamyl-tRNA(Asn/Gln) amidotransferase subunit B [Gaeumannomyces tritici R3-111a-1]EJT76024.1 aspartyl/glutamyl-tRNA(Asn/Gln) amidotransferase subunit B [Gaeumannomyces tritici R3-111a-1]
MTMARPPTAELASYLLAGRLASQGCLRLRRQAAGRLISIPLRRALPAQTRRLHASTGTEPPPQPPAPSSPAGPLRKTLKDQAKAAKALNKGKKKKSNADRQTFPGWELTVGIEVHAQLNTSRKLFSPAPIPPAGSAPQANTLVAPFDLAIPGTQPVFQPGTLVPAIRAALALNCDIRRVSRFDRKHYFHWDQPSGYQITQYYEPLAVDGHLDLRARDGIAPQDISEDGEPLRVRIKQVQMEQDTAKTLARPDGVHWLDFNRCGAPLVEIISEPDMHHPATAAAFVRKVQMLLSASGACVAGMEQGGLRADVNVSVRRVGDAALGRRTEIKNLFSFRAVEDAVIAERDRQIAVLEAGGSIAGETRGWSLGSTETRRLRGKEGEVDYRYMPDPDLGPVVVGDDVVPYLRGTMGVMPDEEMDDLVASHGLSETDAHALMLLDDGGRLEFYYRVVDALEARIGDASGAVNLQPRVLAANWILHVLGSLTSENNARDRAAGGLEPRGLQVTPEGDAFIRPADMADLLFFLHSGRIRQGTAKDVLFAIFNGVVPQDYLTGAPDGGGIERYIEEKGLWFAELSEDEYTSLAESVLDAEEHVLKELLGEQYPKRKLMFLVGQMMRSEAKDRLDPARVQRVMREVVDKRIVALRP